MISNGICLNNVDLPIQDIKSFLLFYAVKRKRDFQLLDEVPNSANVSCCFITVPDIKKTDGNNALLSFVFSQYARRVPLIFEAEPNCYTMRGSLSIDRFF